MNDLSAPLSPARRLGPLALERLKGHCANCGILSRTRLCDACATGEPFCQAHLHMGTERFYQRRRAGVTHFVALSERSVREKRISRNGKNKPVRNTPRAPKH